MRKFLKEFRYQERISTTLSEDLQRIAYEKAIPWSTALAIGIMKLANHQSEFVDTRDMIIKETTSNKIEQLKQGMFIMQERINVLDEENQDLRRGRSL